MRKDNFQIECPINPLSLGQVSFGVLNNLFQRGLNPIIWNVGEIDLSAFNVTDEFVEWLKFNTGRAFQDFSRDYPCVQIWHINGTHKTISNHNVLWTPHECSKLTPTEVGILKNHAKVLVTSKYSQNIFNEHGVDAGYCPNFFDEIHFNEIPKIKKNKIVQWGLFGKLEKRKATLETMITWSKLYGNNKNHRLNCCVSNPFIEPEKQIEIIKSSFGGRIPFNVNILPFQQRNDIFNHTLNFVDIDLSGLSRAEGFGLPHFTCGALNKVCVSLNAHAHKDYNEGDNFVKVEPSGKIPVYDGAFFHEGASFNQGEIFNWNSEDAENGMKKALDIFESGATFNSDLRTRFSVDKTVDTLLSEL